MADVTIYHNPKCGTSNSVLAIARELGVEVDVVEYLKRKPDEATLRSIIAILEDPVADLVRKDSRFEKLGLDAGDYTDADAVVELLVREPALLQRPILVKDGTAIIGRPKERARQLLA